MPDTKGSAPGCSDALQATRAEFNSPALHHDLGSDLGSGWAPNPASGVQSLGSPPSESATEWSVTGPEHRGDLTGQGFDSSTLLRGDDVHAGFAHPFAKRTGHEPREFDSPRLLTTHRCPSG